MACRAGGSASHPWLTVGSRPIADIASLHQTSVMGTTKDLLWKVGFALGYAAISLGAVKALDYLLSVPATLLFSR